MILYLLFFRFANSQSRLRTSITTISIALAAIILTTILSLGQGWLAQAQRESVLDSLSSFTPSQNMNARERKVWIASFDTEFESLSIKEIGLRKEDPSESLPAGLTLLPREDEIWVSPGLNDLISKNPLLKERYKQYKISEKFPRELTGSPQSLLLIYRINDQAIHNEFRQVQTTTAAALWIKYNKQASQTKNQLEAIRTALFLAGIILVVPVLALVIEATRIGIAQRESRYAALRLVGASTFQLRTLSAMETLPLGIVGLTIGIIIHEFLVAKVLTKIYLGNGTLWPEDMRLTVGISATVLIFVLVCLAIAGFNADRLVKSSSLTSIRGSYLRKAPSLLMAVPLLLLSLLTLAMLIYGKPWYEANASLGGIILGVLLLSFIWATFMCGPLLTYLVALAILRCGRGASALMAAHRLRTYPHRTFHSISGVVLSLFVGAIMMSFLATIQITDESSHQHATKAITKNINPLQRPYQIDVPLSQSANKDSDKSLLLQLESDERIKGLSSKTYIQKGFTEAIATNESLDMPLEGNYYASCGELLDRTTLNCAGQPDKHSPVVATVKIVATPSEGAVIQGEAVPASSHPGTTFDKSYAIVAKDSASFKKILVLTQNIAASRQRSTGMLIQMDYDRDYVSTDPVSFFKLASSILIAMITATIVVSGMSQAVGVTGSLFERKKSFVSLRIIGTTLGTLGRAILIEVMAPLIVLSGLVVCLGFFYCYTALTVLGQFDVIGSHFSLPGFAFWIGFALAILLCAATSMLNLPLLARITSYTDLRSE